MKTRGKLPSQYKARYNMNTPRCYLSYLSNPFDSEFRRKKAYGQLVLLGFDVTAFTPAAYQGRRLQPPL